MSIVNPTNYTLRKIHAFDVHNEKIGHRVLIDVLEPIGIPKAPFFALPHLIGYKCDESIVGEGDSVESALNDCLKKISTHSWEDFVKKVNPPDIDESST